MVLWVLIGMALAGERETAEMERLAEDMAAFAERQNWAAVEKRYQEILEIQGVEIPAEVHVSAAVASRAMGNPAATLQRLERAAKVGRTDEIDLWIRELNEQYAYVELRVVPPRSVVLSPAAMPFAPDQRAAVEYAAGQLEEDGEFIGMLPLGFYTLGPQTFEVIPGVTVHVELAARDLRQSKKSAP